jgi:hypothetical protein
MYRNSLKYWNGRHIIMPGPVKILSIVILSLLNIFAYPGNIDTPWLLPTVGVSEEMKNAI